MKIFPNKKEMQEILAGEVSAMDSNAKTFLLSRLMPLEQKTLKWEYGNDEEFPSWVVADLKERNVGIAYCQGGHGASGDTWGLIFFNDDYFGMDAGWYESLGALLNDGWLQ